MECRICSGPADGFHYKTTSCRACSAFFGRTIKLKLQYNCRKQGKCNVSVKNRFSCRYCRMKKCLDVGMTTDDSNVSPAPYLDSSTPTTSTISFLDDDELFTLENIFNNNEQFLRQLRVKMGGILGNKIGRNEQDLSDMYILQQADKAYRFHEEKWPILKKTLKHNATFDMSSMVILCYRNLPVVAEMCCHIPEYGALPTDQKTLIFKEFYIKFLQLDQIFLGVKFLGSARDDRRLLTLEGQVLDFHSSKLDLSGITDFSQEELKEHLLDSEDRYDREFIQPFKMCNPDRFEFLYLMMRTMWAVEGSRGISATTEEIAARILSRCTDELDYYYKYVKKLENPAKRIYRLHNLLTALDRIAEIRRQDSQMTQTFNIFKLDVYLDSFSLDS